VSAPPLRVEELKRLMRRHEGRVDACIVGCGAAGSVLAKELAEGGMSVVVLEAGDWVDSREDMVNDELSMLGPLDWDDFAQALVGSNPDLWGRGLMEVLDEYAHWGLVATLGECCRILRTE